MSEQHGKDIAVPHMTAWSSEVAPAVTLRWKHGRLGFTDEKPQDRDDHGILWARHTDAQGQTRPTFGRVHTGRQRAAMAGLRCQVCNQPVTTTDDSYTWLVDLREAADLTRFRQDWVTTSYPPICAPCLVLSTRRCPALRRGFAILKVRSVSPFGVRGMRFRPAWRGVRPADDGVARHISYRDPATAGVLATQVVVKLHGVRLFDWSVVSADDPAGARSTAPSAKAE
ncbi:hypothetical protein ACWD6P_01830 [Streptomyces sp. NPDC002446]